jgi:hypothetical protein
MSKKTTKSEQEFIRVRALVRAVLLEHGTAVAPGAETPERVDTIINDVACATQVRLKKLSSESDVLVNRIMSGSGRELAGAVSDHFGFVMTTYGDAGYFVGICMGLELAALTVGGAMPAPASTKKAGRR